MNGEPTVQPGQGPTSNTTPRRWDPSYAAVAVTLMGGLIYTFFRLAYASFYATLHTTPEEVGLSYSQTIVRGVIPSFFVVAAVLMIAILVCFSLTSVIGYVVLFSNLFRMYRSANHAVRELRLQVSRDSQAAPSFDQYRTVAETTWTGWRERYPATAGIIAGAYAMSDEDIINTLAARAAGNKPTPESMKLETSRFMSQLTVEFWRLFLRLLLHRATLLVLIILVLLGLTGSIRYQAYHVVKGESLGPALSVLTGLRAERARVNALEAGKNLPNELTTRPVIYLGESDGTAVILIPEGSGTTVRVSLSDIVVQFEN